MISYEVSATVKDELVDRFENYMRGRHIPDLIATGCFTEAIFGRLEQGRYRTQYLAPDEASLERYFSDHGPRLKADIQEHFPSGVDLSRETWTLIQRW